MRDQIFRSRKSSFLFNCLYGTGLQYQYLINITFDSLRIPFSFMDYDYDRIYLIKRLRFDEARQDYLSASKAAFVFCM